MLRPQVGNGQPVSMAVTCSGPLSGAGRTRGHPRSHRAACSRPSTCPPCAQSWLWKEGPGFNAASAAVRLGGLGRIIELLEPQFLYRQAKQSTS